MKIACWSGPRNISTAIMRSWSSRNDTFVSDEPFYAYYLKMNKIKHPRYKEIIDYYPNDYNDVIQSITSEIPDDKKIWYQKHMAHHLFDFDKIDWIKNFENCILIRHPKQVINSYLAKNELKNIEELGYPQQYEIIRFLQKSNKSFIIIDSTNLLKNPEKILVAWCKELNIKFKKTMLRWEKGNHPYDGIWWKHWYDNVINTNQFQTYTEKDISIENQYDSIYNESMRYYKYFLELI